jgi:hypothetical protein
MLVSKCYNLEKLLNIEQFFHKKSFKSKLKNYRRIWAHFGYRWKARLGFNNSDLEILRLKVWEILIFEFFFVIINFNNL